MKKIISSNILTLTLIFVLFLIIGCKKDNKTTASITTKEIIEDGDSTIYGICGEGSSMHSLELISNSGDTLNFLLDLEDEESILGGVMPGDKLAIIEGNEIEGDKVAKKVINLTSLVGSWSSIDNYFKIDEDGKVQTLTTSEKRNSWTTWRINNGKLLLNEDTFSIYKLGADSLYIENDKGIYSYSRVVD